MNHGFSRFALRYLLTLGLGLGLVALHGAGGVLTALVPGCASPWELSKLLYWPLLGALVLERVLSGAAAGSARCLPALTLAPAVLLVTVWILTPPELLSGGVFALVYFFRKNNSLLRLGKTHFYGKATLQAFTDTLFARYQESFGNVENALQRMKELWYYLIWLFDGGERLGMKLRRVRGAADYAALTGRIFRELPLRTDAQKE